MDKTVGRIFNLNVIQPLYKYMDLYEIDYKKYNSNHEDHNIWRDFDDRTYIFSTLRSPVERVVSDFCFNMNYDKNLEKRPSEEWRDWLSTGYTMENFRKWLDTESIDNYQYKTISGGIVDDSLVSHRLSKINFLIRTENIRDKHSIIQNKILNDLGIDITYGKFRQHPEIAFYDIMSTHFLNDNIINKPIYNEILERNSLDAGIYFSSPHIKIL